MSATVFRNGAVFDGHRYLGRADVLVVDGRIGDVGDIPAGAREVDVAGGLVSPGFTDAHVHTVQGGLERIRCDLTGVHTREDYLAVILDYARSSDAEWILGGGWAISAFPGGTPTAAELDVVVADRPVFLPNRDHHGAWVNSRALEIAGVTRETPDPPDGRFERDAD
ncbi:MAG TPA: amidohydrolase family protein, partial [Nocardioidaceae bacterium]|nr:amidohydrolase family protein [Nocardioidaceae bacterium]